MSAGSGLTIDSRDVVVVYGQATMGTNGATGEKVVLSPRRTMLTMAHSLERRTVQRGRN
jgi:hypothetical protein